MITIQCRELLQGLCGRVRGTKLFVLKVFENICLLSSATGLIECEIKSIGLSNTRQ